MDKSNLSISLYAGTSYKLKYFTSNNFKYIIRTISRKHIIIPQRLYVMSHYKHNERRNSPN